MIIVIIEKGKGGNAIPGSLREQQFTFQIDCRPLPAIPHKKTFIFPKPRNVLLAISIFFPFGGSLSSPLRGQAHNIERWTHLPWLPQFNRFTLIVSQQLELSVRIKIVLFQESFPTFPKLSSLFSFLFDQRRSACDPVEYPSFYDGEELALDEAILQDQATAEVSRD